MQWWEEDGGSQFPGYHFIIISIPFIDFNYYFICAEIKIKNYQSYAKLTKIWAFEQNLCIWLNPHNVVLRDWMRRMVPSQAKYPLPPKMADFAKRISCVISIISCEPISEALKNYFRKICHLCGKVYLLLLVHLYKLQFHSIAYFTDMRNLIF